MRRALGGAAPVSADLSESGDQTLANGGAEAALAPRPSIIRWLMVWLLLAAVYALVRLVVHWVLGDSGGDPGTSPSSAFPFDALDRRELAIVPAVQTLALALLAELRRAAKY